jgi:aspartate aminotransferase-like enzyme
MLRKTRLFTPGPTPLLPAAQQAIAAADMHHRTAEFKEIFTRALADLKVFFNTQNDVLILAASGSGAMEASVSNLTSPVDKVVVLTAGKFGERWRDIAKAYGCQIELVSAPYGETFDLNEVKSKLAGARVVYMQGTETSTGARHDVKAVASLLKGTDTLLVVDAITGLGTTNFDPDGWGIAEGGDDPSGAGVHQRERARLEAHGRNEESALLLRLAQGTEERSQG